MYEERMMSGEYGGLEDGVGRGLKDDKGVAIGEVSA